MSPIRKKSAFYPCWFSQYFSKASYAGKNMVIVQDFKTPV